LYKFTDKILCTFYDKCTLMEYFVTLLKHLIV
jgi:hypothetical protein